MSEASLSDKWDAAVARLASASGGKIIDRNDKRRVIRRLGADGHDGGVEFELQVQCDGQVMTSLNATVPIDLAEQIAALVDGYRPVARVPAIKAEPT